MAQNRTVPIKGLVAFVALMRTLAVDQERKARQHALA